MTRVLSQAYLRAIMGIGAKIESRSASAMAGEDYLTVTETGDFKDIVDSRSRASKLDHPAATPPLFLGGKV